MSDFIAEVTTKVAKSLAAASQGNRCTHWDTDSPTGQAMANAAMMAVLPHLLGREAQEKDVELISRSFSDAQARIRELNALLADYRSLLHQITELDKAVVFDPATSAAPPPADCRFCGQRITTVEIPDKRSFVRMVTEHFRSDCPRRS